MKKVSFRGGVLTFYATKKRRILVNTVDETRSITTSDNTATEYEDFRASFSFVPTTTGKKVTINASLIVNELANGNLLSIPLISINRMLPNSSNVFNVVLKGDVQALRQLLESRVATIRDHDEYGASLLHVCINLHFGRLLAQSVSESLDYLV